MIPRYFDWAATTPMCAQALQAYQQTALTYIGNPSSLHKAGIDAAAFLKEQRGQTAILLGVPATTITYTSGATESDSIPILAQLWRRTPGRIIFSSIEHDAISQYRRLLQDKGFDIKILRARDGYVDPDELASLLTADTQLVCVMLVNNVVGTVQPIAEIAQRIRIFQKETGKMIHLHCDAVQALGKIPIDLIHLDVDSAAFSAHKFQGPRGVGILYNRTANLTALSKGGGQERMLRPGTENTAGIAAMNAALDNTMNGLPENLAKATVLRRDFEQRLSSLRGVALVSPSMDSNGRVSPYIAAISIHGIPSEIFTRVMYDRGYCISSGSACSNNTKLKSDTLLTSMGFSPSTAASTIRISFGPATSREELAQLCDTIQEESEKLQHIVRK